MILVETTPTHSTVLCTLRMTIFIIFDGRMRLWVTLAQPILIFLGPDCVMNPEMNTRLRSFYEYALNPYSTFQFILVLIISCVIFTSVIFIEQIDNMILNLINFPWKGINLLPSIKWWTCEANDKMLYDCSMFNIVRSENQESCLLSLLITKLCEHDLVTRHQQPTHFNSIQFEPF